MSQSLCFQGVLLRWPIRPELATARSQSLCFQGVLLRWDDRGGSRGILGLNPFVFRAYYCAIRTRRMWSCWRSLNPFVFRAYYCADYPVILDVPGYVSIPLFSGRITASLDQRKVAAALASQSLCFQGVLLRVRWQEESSRIHVSIPLFSGRITAQELVNRLDDEQSLNPFVFRAYYCVTVTTNGKKHTGLNPFVFRAYYCGMWFRKCHGLRNVSIPLFSGRITAFADNVKDIAPGESQSLCFQGVLLRLLCMERLMKSKCLNPFVFRAYYCGKHRNKPSPCVASQSLCFQGVLLRLNHAAFRRVRLSQSLCFQGVLLRNNFIKNHYCPVV